MLMKKKKRKLKFENIKFLKDFLYRDFSRFSEEWLGSAVVGFGSVTVSVCRLSWLYFTCSARWWRCVAPVSDFYIWYRAGPWEQLMIQTVVVSVPRRLGDCPCLNVACGTFPWTLFRVPKSTKWVSSEKIFWSDVKNFFMPEYVFFPNLNISKISNLFDNFRKNIFRNLGV